MVYFSVSAASLSHEKTWNNLKNRLFMAEMRHRVMGTDVQLICSHRGPLVTGFKPAALRVTFTQAEYVHWWRMAHFPFRLLLGAALDKVFLSLFISFCLTVALSGTVVSPRLPLTLSSSGVCGNQCTTSRPRLHRASGLLNLKVILCVVDWLGQVCPPVLQECFHFHHQ